MMFEHLTLTHLLVLALSAIGTVVVSLFTIVLSKIWGEITSLRAVRHDDRDAITKVDSQLQILEMNLENIGRSLSDFRKDTDTRFNAHKTLLQELAKRDIRAND